MISFLFFLTLSPQKKKIMAAAVGGGACCLVFTSTEGAACVCGKCLTCGAVLHDGNVCSAGSLCGELAFWKKMYFVSLYMLTECNNNTLRALLDTVSLYRLQESVLIHRLMSNRDLEWNCSAATRLERLKAATSGNMLQLRALHIKVWCVVAARGEETFVLVQRSRLAQPYNFQQAFPDLWALTNLTMAV